jgi:hypothetical protein
VFLTPYQGNVVTTFDAGVWVEHALVADLSLAVTGAANAIFDVFCVAGASLEFSAAWASAIARTDALALQDGKWVKSADHSRLYIGTIRCSALNVTEDSRAKRFVWNASNRLPRALLRQETTATWIYALLAYRQANAAVANRVEVVVGLTEALLDLTVIGIFLSASAPSGIAIGEDSTTTPAADLIGQYTQANLSAATMAGHGTSRLVKFVPLGYHAYNWLEQSNSAAASVTFAGFRSPTINTGIQSGLSGYVMA